MEYFLVMYNSRVVIYERKMFIRLATGVDVITFCERKKYNFSHCNNQCDQKKIRQMSIKVAQK